MKKLLTLLLLVLSISGVFAQAPQKMSYQTVIRDSENALVANKVVSIIIVIIQGSPTGTIIYAEKHTPTTNINGLASLEIGGGTVIAGTMASIDWSTGPYFIQTETDPNGGSSYSILVQVN